MPDTIREQIVASLATRLQAIKVASGYKTNMGLNVQRAALYIPEADLPAISLYPRVEDSERRYGYQVSTMPVEIMGFVMHADANPSTISEQMLGDLVKCVLSQPKFSSLVDDIQYKGGGVDEYPESSDTATIVTVRIDVTYSTKIGDPYTQ